MSVIAKVTQHILDTMGMMEAQQSLFVSAKRGTTASVIQNALVDSFFAVDTYLSATLTKY